MSLLILTVAGDDAFNSLSLPRSGPPTPSSWESLQPLPSPPRDHRDGAVAPILPTSLPTSDDVELSVSPAPSASTLISSPPPCPLPRASFLSVRASSSAAPLSIAAQRLLHPRVQRAMLASQLLYNVVVFGASIAALLLLVLAKADLATLPTSLPSDAVYGCLMAFLLSVVLSSPLCFTFAWLRLRHPIPLHRHWRLLRPLYYALRVWTVVGPVVAAAALCSMTDASAATGAAPLLVTVAWVLCGCEASAALNLLLWYTMMHSAFPHSTLSLMPPFFPLSARSMSGKRDPLAERQLREQRLKALAPLRYTADLHCDPTCVICLADMQEGEGVRVFQCLHGYHAECVDRWLAKRPTCPLCLKVVQLPRAGKESRRRGVEETVVEEAVVEMSAVEHGRVNVV